MTIRINPKELLNDLIATGMTREEAMEEVKAEAAKRRKHKLNDVRSLNDYNLGKRGIYPGRNKLGVA